MATMEVVSGKPAMSMDILEVISPAPGCRLLPTAMSLTSLGSTLALRAASRREVASMTSGAVSLSPPRLPLVMGVLTAEQMTTSSSCLAAMGSFLSASLTLASLFIGYVLRNTLNFATDKEDDHSIKGRSKL